MKKGLGKIILGCVFLVVGFFTFALTGILPDFIPTGYISYAFGILTVIFFIWGMVNLIRKK